MSPVTPSPLEVRPRPTAASSGARPNARRRAYPFPWPLDRSAGFFLHHELTRLHDISWRYFAAACFYPAHTQITLCFQ